MCGWARCWFRSRNTGASTRSALRWATPSITASRLRAERSFSQGLLFQVSYTGAKLIDNVNERFLGGTNYINPYDLNMSRSLSAADISQRFVANYVYELPFGHGKRLLSRASAAGFWATGRPAASFRSRPGTPISIARRAASPASAGSAATRTGRRDPNLPDGQQTDGQWFDTSAFANPAAYSFGTGSGPSRICATPARSASTP